ncbi:MAG TPA: hypothetical protein VII80_06050 [Pseudolabrys sp.]
MALSEAKGNSMDKILTAPLFYLMPAPFAVLVAMIAVRRPYNPWLAARLAAGAAAFHADLRFEDARLALLSVFIAAVWFVITFKLYSAFHRTPMDQ